MYIYIYVCISILLYIYIIPDKCLVVGGDDAAKNALAKQLVALKKKVRCGQSAPNAKHQWLEVPRCLSLEGLPSCGHFLENVGSENVGD